VVTVIGRHRSFVLWPVWVLGLVISLTGLAWKWNAQEAGLSPRAQNALADKIRKEFPELGDTRSPEQRAAAHALATKLYGRGYLMMDDQGRSLYGDAYRRTTREWLAENYLLLSMLALSLGVCGLWAGLNFLPARLPQVTATSEAFRVRSDDHRGVVLPARETRIEARFTPGLLGSVVGLGGGGLVLIGAHGEITIPHVLRLRRKLDAITAVQGQGAKKFEPRAATP